MAGNKICDETPLPFSIRIMSVKIHVTSRTEDHDTLGTKHVQPLDHLIKLNSRFLRLAGDQMGFSATVIEASQCFDVGVDSLKDLYGGVEHFPFDQCKATRKKDCFT